MANLINTPNSFLFSDLEVRTASDANGDVWFCAKDVCSALDIQWSGRGNTLRSIPENWVMVSYHETIKGDRETVFINEAALYKMIFRSNKPLAEQFANWVCEDVLPAIRRQGFYGVLSQKEQMQMTGLMMKLVAQLQKTNDAFAFEMLWRRLRNVCNLLGEPMPSVELIGKDRKQLSLEV